jgi:hypothetical protein
MTSAFDICIVAQAGRLSWEAALFAASLRHSAPGFTGELIVGEPAPGPLWPGETRTDEPARELLEDLGARIVPFEAKHFGAAYPNGNKVEMLAALPSDRPFVFFDTDTLVTGAIDAVPFDFARPAASMARDNTWPVVPLYGPGRDAIWRAVFDRADAPFESSLDQSHPPTHWERYLYFNAGWFFGPSAPDFAHRMILLMTSLRDDTPPELASQALFPWLDQIALPAVIAALGGGRPGPDLAGLDGEVTRHWRVMPLFYATAPDAAIAALEEVAAPNKVKKVLKLHEPFRRMIYQGRGRKVRALFDRDALPAREQVIRNRIKREKLWMR